MELIPSILTFLPKNPKPVIVVLLGIIVAGTVAGGMWINSLKVAVEQRDQLLAERDKIAEKQEEILRDKFARELAVIRQKNIYLSEQVRVVKPAITGIQKTVNEIKAYLEGYRQAKRTNRSEADRFSGLLSSLERQTIELNHTIDKMEAISDMADQIERLQFNLPPDSGHRPWLYPLSRPSWIFYMLVALLWVFAYIVFSSFRLKRKFGELKRREEMVSEKEFQFRK
jgi:hypothetical protein